MEDSVGVVNVTFFFPKFVLEADIILHIFDDIYEFLRYFSSILYMTFWSIVSRIFPMVSSGNKLVSEAM